MVSAQPIVKGAKEQPEAQIPSQQDAPKPATGGSSLKSLDALAQQFALKKAEKSALVANVQEETATVYTVNTSVVLNEARLKTALLQVGENWKQTGKFTLGSILMNAGLRVEHNKVVIAVTSDIERGMLEKDRSDLLGRLREVSGYMDMFLDLEVDAALSAQQDTRPYTLEEKLKAMSQLNPALMKLQEIYKTRIVQ